MASGRRLIQLGFMRRFDQSYAEMHAARKDGLVGRALMMHNFHRNVATPAADFTADMAITNSAPHEFDVARFVLGQDYTAISAHKPRRDGPLVGPVFLVLDTKAGQLVTIEINNNAAYGYDVRAELVGETGTVATTPVTYTRRDAELRASTRYDSDWRGRYAQAYLRQAKAFVHFVRTGTVCPIAANAWDGYAAALVAEAGVRALRTGLKVPVEMTAKPAFYDRQTAP